MLATSRKKVACEPLAEMSTFSADIGAAKIERVEAAPAIDGVTAVARVPDGHVVAAAEESTSLPRPPVTTSLPEPPSNVSASWLPMIVSLPDPPSIVRWVTLAGSAEALIESLPLLPLISRLSTLPPTSASGVPVSSVSTTSWPFAKTLMMSAALVPSKVKLAIVLILECGDAKTLRCCGWWEFRRTLSRRGRPEGYTGIKWW